MSEQPTSELITCPTCLGVGQIKLSPYNTGDRVLWNTCSWWGKKPATVLRMSKTGQKVKIKCDPHTDHNGGRPWITYVSLRKLERAP